MSITETLREGCLSADGPVEPRGGDFRQGRNQSEPPIRGQVASRTEMLGGRDRHDRVHIS